MLLSISESSKKGAKGTDFTTQSSVSSFGDITAQKSRGMTALPSSISIGRYKSGNTNGAGGGLLIVRHDREAIDDSMLKSQSLLRSADVDYHIIWICLNMAVGP